MDDMDVAINIGNSNIRVALRNDRQEMCRHIFACSRNINKKLEEMFIVLPDSIDNCIVSSVNPALTNPVIEAVRSLCDNAPIVASRDFDLSLDYRLYEGLLGIDRIVSCEAAIMLAQLPLVIIDMGTATTIDVVDKDGYYLGGMILPGLQMGLSALSSKTSLLPKIQFTDNVQLLGRNTNQCVLSGAMYGTGFLLDKVIYAVWSSFEHNGKVIITGGNALPILPYIETEFIYEENLISIGLFAILDKIKCSMAKRCH
ncbi:MAG: type III pantothenate kinase [Oscillospiraceae bacterium]|nr:type III pantothenate kinase [Oscillospiraceae bacterium]